MKIEFNMPIKLPEKGSVSYDVKTMWRLEDGKKISEFLTLEIDLFGKEYTLENVFPIYKAILQKNPDCIESSLNMPCDMEPTFVMTFTKHSQATEQDREDLDIIHYPPQEPMEWPDVNNELK